MVDRLESGDTITVHRFDRISRGVADFYAIGAKITERGGSLRSISENFDTGTAIGRAMMGFAAIWAELEADTIRERVNNGLSAARARGTVSGRPLTIDNDTGQKIVKRLEAGEHYEDLAREYRVSSRTILRTRKRYDQRPLPLPL